MKNSPKVSLFLDTRYQKIDGTFPLKFQIIFNRITKRYASGFNLSTEEYLAQRDCEVLRLNKTIGTKEYKRLAELRNKINQKLIEIEENVGKFRPFSFEAYESNYEIKTNNNDDVLLAIREKIAELEIENRLGTAVTYKSTLYSLGTFHGKAKLPVGLITPIFLKKYEKWMLENGKSVTTIGYYLRNVRAIINEMINLNKNLNIDYPFGNKKYVIPTKKNIKKALSNEDLKQIFEYKPEPNEARYFNYWIFMYLGNGMNPFDMFSLKFSNIDKDTISFVRHKTVNTNRTETKIQLNFHPKAKEIVATFGNSLNHEDFIFPVFNNKMTLLEKKKTSHQMVKLINKYMRRIAEKLGIDKDITTYVARHSFVTKLITSGANINEVKDLVGHTSIATTEKYIASIEDNRIKQLSNSLLDF